MIKKFVAPAAALLAAGVIGGLASVAAWEAIDPETTTTVREAATPTRDVARTTSTIADVVARAEPSVVEIQVVTSEGFGGQQGNTGSGWVFDDAGHVVTNQHVVGDAQTATVRFQGGKEVDARVIGTDPSTDVAVLELDETSSDVEPLPTGSSNSLRIGDTLIAIGSPLGLQGTVTSGIVSALDRDITAPDGFTIDGAIQTDAALNHGNSGGPLLDADGDVVGMNAQIASETGGNDGIGYAIPIETVKSVADELIRSGRVQHAYLGVRIEDVDGGARITDAIAGGPADDAGLRAGDVVVEVAGTKIDSADQLRTAVTARDPGDKLELQVRRGDQTRTVTVTLGNRPSSSE